MYSRTSICSIQNRLMTWSTHFNDLRKTPVPSIDQDPDEWRFALTLQELKIQALFHETTIIRDADLVNHDALLEMIVTDHEGFQRSLRCGAHVLAIRASASDFSDVNERAAEKRAYPLRYYGNREAIAKLDRVLLGKRLLESVVEIPDVEGVDHFATYLDRATKSKRMREKDREALGRALVGATEPRSIMRAGSRSFVRFGVVYQNLLDHGYSANSGLIKLCRAAHALALPSEFAIPCGFVEDDIAQQHVSVLLGNEAQRTLTVGTPGKFFPKLILSQDSVAQLTFSDIEQLRKHAFQSGYFQRVRDLHRLDSSDLEKRVLGYLEALCDYLNVIARSTDVELHPWMTETAKKELDWRDKRADAIAWAVPVIVATAAEVIFDSPMSLAIASAAFAASEGVKKFRAQRIARQYSPLKKMLTGTTVSPVAAAKHLG